MTLMREVLDLFIKFETAVLEMVCLAVGICVLWTWFLDGWLRTAGAWFQRMKGRISGN